MNLYDVVYCMWTVSNALLMTGATVIVDYAALIRLKPDASMCNYTNSNVMYMLVYFICNV